MSEVAEGTRGQTPEDVQKITPAPVFVSGDPVPGLSSWLLERRLGGGGFGEVWLAKHEWKPEHRAVKFCTDLAAKHRLVTHEKNVVLRVMKYAGSHPNIVPLLDCNLDGSVPWLMYEYVEGGTLAGTMREWRALPLPKRLGRAVRALHAIAGALAACHRLDPPLVHRDLKPQNVLMAGNVPRITDFGIGGVVTPTDAATAAQTAYAARLPSALHSAGTRLYAPPEQMFGAPPNPRDDVYALGIIAYQMVFADLTSAPGPDATLELRDLKVPSELASLIVKSVAMNPDRRLKDAGEWEAALAALIEKAQKPVEPANGTAPGSRAVSLPEPGAPQLSHTEPIPTSLPSSPLESLDDQPAVVQSRTKRSQLRAFPLVVISGALVLVLGLALVAYFASRKPVEPTTPSERVEKSPNPPKNDSPNPRSVIVEAPKPGEAREFPLPDGLKMTFCWVPGGECQLGSPKAERNPILKLNGMTEEATWSVDEAEENRGKFKTDGFWMGKYEVTQAEWEAVMRVPGTVFTSLSHFRVGGKGVDKLGGIVDTSRFPVESVSWNDCQQFLEKLREFSNHEKVFGTAGKFVLPHEDEWEYACRGGLGNKQPFYFGKELNGTQANADGQRPFGTTTNGPNLQRPTVVGSYAKGWPHPWGLCDLHGNVFEWCSSSYDKTSDWRALRGGSWGGHSNYCRTASRHGRLRV